MKGIGPKKIKTLWREYNIENIEQLLVACEAYGKASKSVSIFTCANRKIFTESCFC